MAAAFSGAGTGAMFSPIFIWRGMYPLVSFATAMYIAMFTTLVATIVMILFDKLLLDYAFYVLLMTVCGTIPGMFFQYYLVNKLNRISHQLWISVTLRVVGLSSMTVLTISKMIEKRIDGLELF